MSKYIAVEIGGTKQQIAVGTADGKILQLRTVRLGSDVVAADILSWIKKNIDEIMSLESIDAIGCGFGGVLEFETGRSLQSMHVEGWKDFELRTWFTKEFGLSSVVLNDTVAGGIGELYIGAGKGSRRLFYTNIGTGIGGGFYIDGKCFDCFGYGSSYFGNTWIPDWRTETPGAKTRVEYVCSGMNIEKRLNQPGYISPDSMLAGIEGKVTCVDLAQGVRMGDPFCTEELDHIAQSFSVGLANLMALMSPDRVVIGGGVAKMGDILFSRIRKYTEEYAFVANAGRFEIKESQLLDDAVLVGALLAAGNPEIIS